MKTPANYKIVFSKLQHTITVVSNDAVTKDSVNAEFHGLRKYLDLALEKCNRNSEYCNDWLLWLTNKKGTLLLRELFKSVGCDYWDGIYNGNVIDRLDSLQFEITK